ncbi:hypothetical protein P7L74_02890 (plasmid) [Tistrella mobilis]|jgi:hypothetical protein|uniref:hypothetical protein n=1 Tax=Tistrella mobilis TaxID=171437 RepID=UPI003556D809
MVVTAEPLIRRDPVAEAAIADEAIRGRLACDPARPWPVPPVSIGDWQLRLPACATRLMRAALAAGLGPLVPELLNVRLCRPIFHARLELAELLVRRADGRFATLLLGMLPDRLGHVDGTSRVIHALNAADPPLLDGPEQAMDYLRWFCAVVCGDHGGFPVVECLADLPFTALTPELGDRLAQVLTPLTVHGRTAGGDWMIAGCVLHAGALYQVEMRVRPDGLVEMLDDCVALDSLPCRRPGIRKGYRLADVAA